MRPYVGVFPGDTEQVGKVREAVRCYLDGCPAADDVTLVVSEFAANAVRHSNSRGSVFTVQVERCEHWVHVAVIDKGGRWVNRTYDDGCPHGLEIVARLAGRIGVMSDVGRRIVFVTLHF